MEESREIRELELISYEVRRRIFATVLNAGSGHLGGSSSSVELMVALYFGGVLRFDPANPRHHCRDRVVVRGHLGPLRYSIFALLGWIDNNELSTYRSFGSRLQGHESMELVPGVDITPSGSLGMLLSYGVGCAFSLRKQGIQSHVYVFLGDGEEQEGNVSEAARHASHLGLSNLVCIIDRNTKQLSQPIWAVDSGADIKKIWDGYGWDVKEIKNGHSIVEILEAFNVPRNQQKPTVIIANTVKGYGLRDAETHPSGYHTLSTCPRAYVAEAIVEIEKRIARMQDEVGPLHHAVMSRLSQIRRLAAIPSRETIQLDIHIAPGPADHFDDAFIAYCRDLVAVFTERFDFRLYVLTADWISHHIFNESHFDRAHVNYVNVGIREQHLFAMAHGISVSDPSSRILIIEGDGFALRFSDQLHAIAQAGSKMVVVGTDSGICEARNGPTHQSTGQPGMLVSMPRLRILEPADAVDLNNCFNWALTEYPGPVYIRLHSASVARLSAPTRNIQCYVVYQPKNQCRIVLVGSGLPLGGMVELAEKLDTEEIGAKVINVLDMEHLNGTFVELLEDGVPVLTIYNGNQFVLQSAVARAIMEYEKPRPSIIRGHGFALGTTGKLEDLLKNFKLDARGIEEVIKRTFAELLL